jgi:uncharacterized protein YndB with AHSA1/START domain
MLLTTSSPVGAKLAIDQETNTITLTRTLSAPREHVFRAWTQPEHVQYWWDPTGASLAECAIDLRPGGSFRFVTRRGHGGPAFTGVYREITPSERLVFEAMGSVGRVVLEDIDGATRMTVTIVCASSEHLAQFIKMGVDVGTSKTLDNLVEHVAAMAHSS